MNYVWFERAPPVGIATLSQRLRKRSTGLVEDATTRIIISQNLNAEAVWRRAGRCALLTRVGSHSILTKLSMAQQDALQGSLPLLILKILDRRGPLHGYGITARIEAVSDLLRVEEGSLYPALHRMEETGWIRARWETTENNRRARVYELTALGRKQLQTEERRWTSISTAISRVLQEG